MKEYFLADSLSVSKAENVEPMIKRAERLLEETTRRVNGEWETGLLWRSEESLPESRDTALQRLYSLERRLDKDSRYAEAFYTEFSRFIEKGYLVESHGKPTTPRTWYLPHFCVFNPNRPNKTRLVFDAAARSRGFSLDDFLVPGPVFIPNMMGVIMRFRQGVVGIKGDITDMFLRVHKREEDQCAQRVLTRGRRRIGKPRELVVTRLMFGVRPSPCSAIYVQNRNATEHPRATPEEVRSVVKNSFVDDYFDSRDTVEKARQLAPRVNDINASGGFHMHDWASNRQDALSGIPTSARTVSEVKFKPNGSVIKVEKALGMRWDTQMDTLRFNDAFAKHSKPAPAGPDIPTKRKILSIVMSIFDPLGLLAPFTVRAKMLMREIWRSDVGWDEPVKESEHLMWRNWISDLVYVGKISVPRHSMQRQTNPSAIELHTFCDASSQAYAAVCFWRFIAEDGLVIISLVASKSRVAPLKSTTIPRIELQAALLGYRLDKCVEQEHDMQPMRRIYWSDSRTVLYWIRSGARRYLPFVANRISEIRQLTAADEWRWTLTELNAVDAATRVQLTVKTFGRQWFEGPRFLTLAEADWPLQEWDNTAEESLARSEIAKGHVYAVKASEPDRLSLLPSVERFSLWNRLLRSTAFTLFVAGAHWQGNREARVTTDNLIEAENLWLRKSQIDAFPEEINALSQGRSVHKGSRLTPLCPFLDTRGCLRVNGRLRDDQVPIENKHVIIDGRQPVTKLMLMHFHANANHGSSENVINEVRQHVWVVGLRRALRSVVTKCQFCLVKRSRPRAPLMGKLPPARTAYSERPFSRCGFDYFGPMTVRIGRRREKRWGALFTCLTTRAVHIELAHTLSTDSVIMAVRRLSARRGHPVVLYSDNGTNFRGASDELKDFVKRLDRESLENYATERRKRWVFIPPAACITKKAS